MDLALLIGMGGAFGAMLSMVFLEGSDISTIVLPAPMVMVFGATIAVSFGSGTVGDGLQAVKALPKAFRGKVQRPSTVVDELVRIAEKARREGLLSLESDATEATDPFLKNALQNVADGVGEEELRQLLEDEIATKERVGKATSKWFKIAGGYAPTIGIVGTVVTLTHVLANLSSPDKLGPMIAAAFVATLWGLLSANFLWLPIGDRLARITELETERRYMILEAVLAVQAGAGPRLLGERLQAMIPDAGKSPSKAQAAQPDVQKAA